METPGLRSGISFSNNLEDAVDRDFAIRLEGFLLGARAHLDCITFFMKGNLPPDDFKRHAVRVGEAMDALIEISNELYLLYPDTVPKELAPPMTSEDNE